MGETGVDIDSSLEYIFDNEINVEVASSFKKNIGRKSIIKGTKGTIIVDDTWIDGKIISLVKDNNKKEYKFDNTINPYTLEIDNVSQSIINKSNCCLFPGTTFNETLINTKILNDWIYEKNKFIDCVTFFDNNYMFDIRYKTLESQIDYFVICESKFDHKGDEKGRKFIFKEYFDQNKIKYLYMDKPFPKNTNRWENQAIQRDFILKNLDFANSEDYIFFSDPDEIIKPEILINFELQSKYGIFLFK